jgi:hypothetical protein
MPANERSARITDAYRERLLLLQQRAVLLGRWTVNVQDIDGTGKAWADRAVAQLGVIQRTGVTLTAGYIAAFIASELGRRPEQPPVDHSAVGKAQDGQPLEKSLLAALITVKTALKQNRAAQDALRLGEQRATRLIASTALAAPRAALHSAIETDPQIVGWRRVTFGGCGACLAAADGVIHDVRKPLRVHDHCRCTAEPVLEQVTESFHRPTGRETFDGMSFEQQAALLGEEKAALIRSGTVPFERLIQPQPMAIAPDGITERPLAAL